ncbi:bifunctional hydroxymethylpyrimidine kinase/phosphomethylpyrimidine kinase [Salirhabdus sp. Marseille-P4669]|uniref:bifunctional hydroxymethylpyrimidine kinase/phosphomethylpyrimidine kinase n=1 Tax=Salirhabdus sp. Marseille-P4669 TaxID=2042310 RepID=UPI000C7D5BC2|nr:bifunctional hydroxymethylpyrimidine kinase/phosphomethylpyrimidine kinase [Salirhabdus sp. Marseille-P4669]
MTVYKALTIAGSDSGGGAGIQADLKTFQERKAFGMSVVTAVTAQNTLGVQGVYPIPTIGVIEQINAVTEDIGADAVKTGMLFSSDIIKAVSDRISYYGMRNIVVDPVMVAKGGATLLQEEAINALKEKLIPLATVVTPNIPEAEMIVGFPIHSLDDRKEAAMSIVKLGARSVLMKGGHLEGDRVVDLYYDGSTLEEFVSPRIHTKHTHGTGCTLSAAITAELAKGKSVKDAVQIGKDFIHAAIEKELGIGHGHGPTNHWAYNEQVRSEVK